MSHVMSDEDSEKGSSRERKQKLYDHIESTQMDSSRAMRTLRKELPWKDWFLIDFLRYWYWIGILFLEVVVLSFAIMFHVHDILGILAFIAISIGVLYLGYRGYVLIWPLGGFTSVEQQKRKLRHWRHKPRDFE